MANNMDMVEKVNANWKLLCNKLLTKGREHLIKTTATISEMNESIKASQKNCRETCKRVEPVIFFIRISLRCKSERDVERFMKLMHASNRIINAIIVKIQMYTINPPPFKLYK